ncbi:uncharacterized protein LOC123308285 isoform X1 [Coccinella septempunctata]|uniref:uncharacterized protein LOC123308285 isoform X1 n=1 Tax=Coccinella septempunctata TaxID=41139 RepID=UPI001D08A71F|nr:uncharacterized protein LOC123308285 isoform X1 [Coccinella septempunctata]
MALLQLLQSSVKMLGKFKYKPSIRKELASLRYKSDDGCRKDCDGHVKKKPCGKVCEELPKKGIPCSPVRQNEQCEVCETDPTVRKPCPIACNTKPCEPQPCKKRKNPCLDCDCEVR